MASPEGPGSLFPQSCKLSTAPHLTSPAPLGCPFEAPAGGVQVTERVVTCPGPGWPRPSHSCVVLYPLPLQLLTEQDFESRCPGDGRLGTQPLQRTRPARQSLLWLGAIQLDSDPGAQAQGRALGASEALPPPWWGSFSTLWVSPRDQVMHRGRSLVSGKEREVGVEKPTGGGKGRHRCSRHCSPGTKPHSAGLPLLPRP